MAQAHKPLAICSKRRFVRGIFIAKITTIITLQSARLSGTIGRLEFGLGTSEGVCKCGLKIYLSVMPKDKRSQAI